MKAVYVVCGRVEWAEVARCLDEGNRFEEARIYGVFESFEAALEKFKSCVSEAVEYFCEDNTPFAFFDSVNDAMSADYFSDYNTDAIASPSGGEPEFGWECSIEEDSASWVMTAAIDYDEWEFMVLPSLQIKREILKV